MNDLIKREDAIEAVASADETNGTVKVFSGLEIIDMLNALPIAEPQGELISREDAIAYIDRVTNSGLGRNKSLDYIRKYIDALPSADAVQGWIPFKMRPLTDEEKQEYPDWAYIFDCLLPDDEEEILLSNGKHVWTDTFINDGECYLDGGDDIDDGMAWMPLPKPYKGGDTE